MSIITSVLLIPTFSSPVWRFSRVLKSFTIAFFATIILAEDGVDVISDGILSPEGPTSVTHSCQINLALEAIRVISLDSLFGEEALSDFPVVNTQLAPDLRRISIVSSHFSFTDSVSLSG